jgi:hypothetical protein
MSRGDEFQQFLALHGEKIPELAFVGNLLLSVFLSLVLAWVYSKFGQSLSDRKKFSSNFLLLTMCTMVIITLVKSNLSLSLGLIGALSIVRYRSAIKEPEELSFLFISIMIGIGLGAGQTLITCIAFFLIIFVIYIRHVLNYLFTAPTLSASNLYINIKGKPPVGQNPIGDLTRALNKYCSSVDLRRYDITAEFLEASFLLLFDRVDSLDRIVDELSAFSEDLQVTFIDNKGIM